MKIKAMSESKRFGDCPRRLIMKRILPLVATVALLYGAGQSQAGPIPYPTPGVVNPVTYSFSAANTGDIVAYYAAQTGAAYTEDLGLLVNGVDTGIHGLQNHSTPTGTALDFGSVKKGDVLTFYIRTWTNGADYGNTTAGSYLGMAYSNPALNGPYDGGTGINHIYSTDYTQGGGLDPSVPTGTYVGFEDLPVFAPPDYNYADEQFVFTNVAMTSTAPEPATLALLGIGIAGMTGYGWRRRKAAAA
jgi:PEP-CTERM motif